MGPPEPELEPEAGTKVEAENLSQKLIFWFFLSPQVWQEFIFTLIEKMKESIF